jgi:hypothetical protein
MPFRFVTKSIHAYLIDYPVAIVLIVAPFLLKLGQSGPVAMWLSVVAGVAALLLAALTDHPAGVIRSDPLLDAPVGRPRRRRCLPGRALRVRLLRAGCLVLLGARCGRVAGSRQYSTLPRHRRTIILGSTPEPPCEADRAAVTRFDRKERSAVSSAPR